jgi:hypothetical protein
MASHDWMVANNESGRFLKGESWPNIRYHCGVCLERLCKTKRSISQDVSLCLSQDLNQANINYKSVFYSLR